MVMTCLLLGTAVSLQAQYPRIQSVSSQDELYRQQQSDIQRFYRRFYASQSLPQLVIYQFRPDPSESLISIAARFSLPYSTLASINRLESADIPERRRRLLVPNMPGLFVPRDPESPLEQLMAEHRTDTESDRTVTLHTPQGRTTFDFYANADYTAVERRAFLRVLFRRPVENTAVSSGFGWRRNPVTGVRSFHGGADFPATRGTEVLAARSGTVIDQGNHVRYGRYVLLEHENGYTTFYGHLQSISVELQDTVRSGSMIGRVGNTGLSTGPHLHFEIRMEGVPLDPVPHFPGLSR